MAEQPNQSFALARTGRGEIFLLRASVEKEAPHKLLFVFFEPVEDPNAIIIPDPKRDDQALVAAVRADLAARVRADEFSGVVLVANGPRVLFLALSAGKIVLPDVANGLAIAGGAPGINAAVEWERRAGYIVIVLSNFDPPAASDVARRIVNCLPS